MNNYNEAREKLNAYLLANEPIPPELREALQRMGYDPEVIIRKSKQVLEGSMWDNWPEMPGIDVLPWNTRDR